MVVNKTVPSVRDGFDVGDAVGIDVGLEVGFDEGRHVRFSPTRRGA